MTLSKKAITLLPLICMLFVYSLITKAGDTGVIHLSQQEFKDKIAADTKNVAVIDVRTPSEFKRGRVPGAINIPHDQILDNISLLDKFADKDIVFYCHSGTRVGRVTDYLEDANYSKVYHLKGDYRAWRANSQTIEK